MEEFIKAHAKDGILAIIVLYLLWTDRQDRKEDRKFWSEFFKKKEEGK